MKYYKSEGCICDSLQVNGKEEIDMTDEERQSVINDIFKYIRPRDLNYLLQWFVELYGEYRSDDEPCECCGDYVCEWTLDTDEERKR